MPGCQTIYNHCLSFVALIQVGRCHSILIEREAVNVFFKEAIDLLGDMPPSKRFQSVERWGEGETSSNVLANAD